MKKRTSKVTATEAVGTNRVDEPSGVVETAPPDRFIHRCDLCHEMHQAIQYYLNRHQRRPYTTAAELEWLAAHCAHAGLPFTRES